MSRKLQANLRRNRLFYKTSRPRIQFHPKARVHVILMDGTLSTLRPRHETNVGLLYKMLRNERDLRGVVNVYYQPGLQWRDWANAHHLAVGRGVNQQIKAAYGWLATRYKEGDEVYLFGYSRGAFAVRSLSGLIARYGLLKAEFTTERAVQRHFRLYRRSITGVHIDAYRMARCHPQVKVNFLGVWDTVKAMGLRFGLLDRLLGLDHDFHDHHLASCVERGVHVLGRDERRMAYAPVLWVSDEGARGRVLQLWMRGTHGDVGGQLGGAFEARALSNAALKLLLLTAEEAGLPLGCHWKLRVRSFYDAPSIGQWSGIAKVFLWRKARPIGRDPSEVMVEDTPYFSEL